MTRVSGSKASNRNLVFVKDVPQYMAKTTIPDVFAKYNPISAKNIYPRGKTTTIVFIFRTRYDASQAQEATDQQKLDGIILRVEMYRQQQSMRYLRQNQVDNSLPDDAYNGNNADDYEEEEAWGETTLDNGIIDKNLVPPQSLNTTPQKSIWAGVVANVQETPSVYMPDFPGSAGQDTPSTTIITPASIPRIYAATPNVWPATEVLNDAQAADSMNLAKTLEQESKATKNPLNKTISSDLLFDDEDIRENSDKKEKQVQTEDDDRKQEVVVAPDEQGQGGTKAYTRPPLNEWVYMDSTTRIRQMHFKSCALCQMMKKRL